MTRTTILTSLTYPVVKVFLLFLVWCSLGLFLEIPGPTMIDIKLIFKATYEDVSRSVSGRGAGGFTGAVIGGILVDKYSNNLDLFIGVSMAIASGAIMLIPFSFSVHTLWFHYFILGTCGGVIGIAGVRSAMSLWPEKTTVTLQLLHVGYGVGSLLVPVLVNPFLAVLKYKRPTGSHPSTNDVFTVVKDTRVQFVFISIGLGTLALASVFFYLQIRLRNHSGYNKLGKSESKTSSKLSEMINPGTYANGQIYYGAAVLVCLFVFFFTFVGAEELFGHFIRSFSVDTFHFTKSQASYLNMTFWLGLTIGRLIGAYVSTLMPVRRFFAISVLLHAISATLLNVYVSGSSSMLWFCTAMEGFTMAPLYPAAIAYGNTLIEVTGMCLMVIQFAGSFGDLSFIWIAGRLYQMYGPQSVLYALQIVGIVLCACVAMLRCVGRHRIDKLTIEISVP